MEEQDFREDGPLRGTFRSPFCIREAMAGGFFEGSSDGVAVLDLDGRVLSINRAGLRMQEIERLELCLNLRWTTFWKGDYEARASRAIEAAIYGGEGRFQARTVTPDGGESRFWDVLVSPVKEPSGKIVNLIAVSRDVTEAARNAELLRNAAEKRDEFLAMLAHQLRNPVGAIASAIRVWDTSVPNSDEMSWIHKVFTTQAIQLARIADELLDASRIIFGNVVLRMEPLDLSRLLARIIESARPMFEKKEDLFDTDIALGLRVKGDPERLEQAIWKLLENAVKFTRRGGHVVLSASREEGEVVLHVRDNGRGITGEELLRIFDLFAQQGAVSLDRPLGGLGIGLNLVKKVAELHSGSVSARSEGIGKGADFELRLPALKENVIRTPAFVQPAPPSEATNRVLVVDDNKDIANGIQRLLRRKGYEVALAHDGMTALDAAAAFHPDAVLLDIGLPELDGYEVARRMRNNGGAHFFIVAISGYCTESDLLRAREAGFDDYLVKPLNFEELFQMFHRR